MNTMSLKRALVVLLAMLMCFSLLPPNAFADDTEIILSGELAEESAGESPVEQPASDSSPAPAEPETSALPEESADQPAEVEEFSEGAVPADTPQEEEKLPEMKAAAPEGIQLPEAEKLAAEIQESSTVALPEFEENTADAQEEDSDTLFTSIETETAQAKAMNAIIASGECGPNLMWTLTDAGLLSITGSGEMNDMDDPSNGPFYLRRTKIKSISIGEGVTSIGADAFLSCSTATSISLPSTLTSIGQSAFRSCGALTEITIPQRVTSIGAYAFAYCVKLTDITIPFGVTEIGEQSFNGCSSLEKVVIPSSVTSIGDKAFYNCQKLSIVAVPAKVKHIGNQAFQWCAMTEVTLPATLESCGESAFAYCPYLASLQIAEGAKAIGGYAFTGCRALREVTIPSSVTEIGIDAFDGCEGLKNVTITEGVTSIGQAAFLGCTSLSEITIPGSVQTIGSGAFLHCTALTTLTVKQGVKTIKASAFNECTALKKVSIPASLSVIESAAFLGDLKITDVFYGSTKADREAHLSDGTWNRTQNQGTDSSFLDASWHYQTQYQTLFSDVGPDDFYYEAVNNMAANGIITGWADGTFRPNNNCNRAAVVTFLWRMAGRPEPAAAAQFTDMTDNPEFNKAISWAVERGITTGWADGTFRPWNTCNRAAIVTFLWRYAGRPEPAGTAQFSDMTGNPDFDKAITWAAEKGITTGWADGTFRPWNECLRLAVASFLYRYSQL